MKVILRYIDKILSASLILAMASILLVVVWQVVSRYVLQDPASVTEELSRFLLIWIGILGAAYAYRHNAHLGFDMLVNRQSELTRKLIYTLIELAVAAFVVAVLLIGGTELVALTFRLNQVSGSLGVRIGWIYMVLPVSGAIIFFFCMANICALWSATSEEVS